MSGTNPFRRRDKAESRHLQQESLPAGPDALNIRFPPIDTDVPKTTKGKTVRIISPHYSRSKESYGASTINSPPPRSIDGSPPADADSPSSAEPSPVDPFDPQSDEAEEDEDLRRNTVANAAIATSQIPPNLRMPINPGMRAPALQFGGDALMSGTREQSEPSTATLTANRPHYDVDDFKRLLLTGEKVRTDKNTSTATVPPAPMQGLQLGDSNSNTDASSVSRQSIFEPHPDLNPESPSTSMDVPLSDDERHGLVQSSPNVGRSRPSVPPSRHGKLVKQTVPQTVAFENLSSSPPGPSLPPISFMESSPLATLDTSRDIDKPLPLPPQTESPKSMESRSGYTSSAAEAPHRFSTTENHTDRVATKRSAPPLPAARRHGQARSRSSTNDSSRSTSITEEMSQHTLPSPTNSSSTTSLKPPLPPPRRTGTNPGQENTNPATAVATVNDPVELPASKARPPAPPSRTPSTTSIKRMSRAPTNPGSPAPAPPPPPRRRGSSQSQSSFIPSRLSGEYRISSSERARSGSGASSTQQPSLPEAPTEEKDIMADLTALQREVDELRGKFGR